MKMADLREKVESDRGIIKTIQLAIPGYRGYRKKEDLRIADRLLREELANRFSEALASLEGVRKALAKRKALELMEDAGELVTRASASIARLKHAEHGYTGISPDYRINEAELNRMYEWDLRLLELIEGLKTLATGLRNRANDAPESQLAAQMSDALIALESYDGIFDSRREAIAGLSIG